MRLTKAATCLALLALVGCFNNTTKKVAEVHSVYVNYWGWYTEFVAEDQSTCKLGQLTKMPKVGDYMSCGWWTK